MVPRSPRKLTFSLLLGEAGSESEGQESSNARLIRHLESSKEAVSLAEGIEIGVGAQGAAMVGVLKVALVLKFAQGVDGFLGSPRKREHARDVVAHVRRAGWIGDYGFGFGGGTK